MIAIKPCWTQIYLFLYIKSHLIVIHTAKNDLPIIGMVQAQGGRCPWKKFGGGVKCINVIGMTRINRDNKMQCLQKY